MVVMLFVKAILKHIHLIFSEMKTKVCYMDIWHFYRTNMINLLIILGMALPLPAQFLNKSNEINAYTYQQDTVKSKNNIIYSMTRSPKDHSIWYSDKAGIYMTKSHEIPPQLILKRERGGINATNLVVDKNDNIYFTLGDSLVITNKNDILAGISPSFKVSVSRSGQQSISKDVNISTIVYQPKEKVLWVGTESQGLYKFIKRGNKWNTIAKNYFDESGNPFPERSEYNKYEVLSGNKITNIFIDQWENVWVCTNNGTTVFEENKEEWIPIWTPSAYGITAFEKKNQEIWISFVHTLKSTNILGRVILPDEKNSNFYKNFRRYLKFPLEKVGSDDERKGRGEISYLRISENKDIWLASSNLTRIKEIVDQKIIEENIEKTVFSERHGLPPIEKITGLEIDKNNYLWIATDGWGLFTIKLGLKLKAINEKTVVCNGEKNATFTVVVADGKPPYELSWKQTSGTHAKAHQLENDTFVFKNLGIDTFDFTLTDSLKKDFVRGKYVIRQPDKLEAEIEVTKKPDYPDDDRGSGKVMTKGGQVYMENNDPKEIYTVLWQWSKEKILQSSIDTLSLSWERNGSPYYTISKIGVGKYKAIVLDTVGCKIEINGELSSSIRGIKEFSPDKLLKKGQFLIIRNENGGTHFFENGTAELIEDPNSALDEVADYLKEHSNVIIKLHGHTAHTDPVSGVSSDQQRKAEIALSKERAMKVRKYLLAKGVKEKQVSKQVVGHGSKEPLPSSEGDYQRNLRVEIEIIGL